MPETFTCAMCHRVLKKGWSDEEARQEYAETFPEIEASGEAVESVCEDCYGRVAELLRSLGIGRMGEKKDD